jgi:hypothetical protein
MPATFAVRLRQAARKSSEDALGGAVARDQGDLAKAASGPFPYAVEVPVARLVLVVWQGAGGVVGMTVTVFGDERGGCCGDARAACEARAGREMAAAGAVGKDGQQGKWRVWGCDGGGFRGVLLGACLWGRRATVSVRAVATVATAVKPLPNLNNYLVPIAAAIVTKALNMAVSERLQMLSMSTGTTSLVGEGNVFT